MLRSRKIISKNYYKNKVENANQNIFPNLTIMQKKIGSQYPKLNKYSQGSIR
jgi:hypothetical protein